jgi:hypothetical protein
LILPQVAVVVLRAQAKESALVAGGNVGKVHEIQAPRRGQAQARQHCAREEGGEERRGEGTGYEAWHGVGGGVVHDVTIDKVLASKYEGWNESGVRACQALGGTRVHAEFWEED